MHFTKKILTITIFSFFWFLFFQQTYAYIAKERDLPWINIIKRTDWVTDSSLLFKKTTSPSTPVNTDTDETDIVEPIALTKNQTITSYLKTVFPEQVLLNGIIKQVNGKELNRAQGYKNKKTHIVVHHTVNDIAKITTPEQAKGVINSIFRYHTLTNQRWDIGYNFIIDPRGNIYEGRGWWESVVAAHAKFNNASSLGIALLGNFEINEPTDAQIAALTKLSTALMIRYNINPDSEIYSHIDHAEHPYVKDVITDSFIGHRDTGKTACPGKNLYNRLTEIQESVRNNLVIENKLSRKTVIKRINYIATPYVLHNDKNTITIPVVSVARISRCSSTTKNVKVSCTQENTGEVLLSINKRRTGQTASGPVVIAMTTKGTAPNIKTVIQTQWMSDQTISLEQRKKNYISKNNISLATSSSNKVNNNISLSKLRQLSKQDVNVLLYEASTTLPQREFLCQNCIIQDDQGTVYTDNIFTIIDNGTSLTYSSKTKNKTIKTISITPKRTDGTTFILNYNRKSYANIAWNHFYGTITIAQQPIKLLDNPNITQQYVVMNNLPFDLYLRGIIESNDTEPTEKIKTMSLLAKNYILFYLDPAHRHPSIPEKATYLAVDDARIFQKYVGAGVDTTLTKWKQALEDTRNQIVTYQENLAFLPYFSCSAWFTRSAEEKYGRQDTPYLVSVYDPSPCNDFNGHGVGLAGNGASYLAKNGSSYRDIIQHFYPGTSISSY